MDTWGRGRNLPYRKVLRAKIITMAAEAEAQGLSQATVYRIWKQHNLKPHLVKTFKLSCVKHFVEKLQDVVGLYLNPPDKALVLCVDEKSQIQALDLIQPGLPMTMGHHKTQTHDYKRNGTTTLFAALSMLDGKVIGDSGFSFRRLASMATMSELSCWFNGSGTEAWR